VLTADLPTIYTIGHSTRTLDELIAGLHAHGVVTLVDIRAFPMSRRLPHFNREVLERELPKRGIEYVWMKSLGGRRKKTRNDSPNTGLRNDSFRNYADYMLTPEFAEAIESLLEIAARGKTAIMCAERMYFQCHRMLASTAEAGGIRLLNDEGVELLRVCQDGRLLPQTGFTNVTSNEHPDFLFVTQVGAKACEATLYRKWGAHYIRVGWWSGWEIRPERWHNRPAIHYEELEPTLDHPKSVVYFTWNGHRLVPNRAAPMSFH